MKLLFLKLWYFVFTKQDKYLSFFFAKAILDLFSKILPGPGLKFQIKTKLRFKFPP